MGDNSEKLRQLGLKLPGNSSESPLVLPPTHAHVERLFPGYRELFQDRLIKLGVIFPEQEVPFLDELKRHGDDSEAWYFCDKWRVGRDVVMGQYMRRLSVSSVHKHRPGIYEFYSPLAGDFYVRIERGNERIHHRVATEDGLEIPIDTHHGAFTMQDDTIAVIVMRGAAEFPEDQWHSERRRFEWAEKK